LNVRQEMREMVDYYLAIEDKTTITPKYILDIGSQGGHHAEALRKLFQIAVDRVFVVDPDPNALEMLRLNYGFTKFPVAISNVPGPRKFNQLNSGDEKIDGASSLMERPRYYDQSHLKTRVIEVGAITGQALLIQLPPVSIEICKIDVEGHAYEVLQSFGNAIHKIRSFHVECETKEVWDNQKFYPEVARFLKNKGYVEVHKKDVYKSQCDSIWIIGEDLKNPVVIKPLVAHV